jgi:hypothetical protein
MSRLLVVPARLPTQQKTPPFWRGFVSFDVVGRQSSAAPPSELELAKKKTANDSMILIMLLGTRPKS